MYIQYQELLTLDIDHSLLPEEQGESEPGNVFTPDIMRSAAVLSTSSSSSPATGKQNNGDSVTVQGHGFLKHQQVLIVKVVTCADTNVSIGGLRH